MAIRPSKPDPNSQAAAGSGTEVTAIPAVLIFLAARIGADRFKQIQIDDFIGRTATTTQVGIDGVIALDIHGIEADERTVEPPRRPRGRPSSACP